jgi:hypothetical protein
MDRRSSPTKASLLLLKSNILVLLTHSSPLVSPVAGIGKVGAGRTMDRRSSPTKASLLLLKSNILVLLTHSPPLVGPVAGNRPLLL